MIQHEQPPRAKRPDIRFLLKARFHLLSRWLLLALGLLMLGTSYETASEASDALTYRPPGRLINVGGHRLHLHCLGRGGPTVVIDAGLGDWSTSWMQVQALAARTTRVCTYDRAGMGFSEPGEWPRTAERFAAELHTLLRRAGVEGPYVLAGHSMGGLTVRVFTRRYPTEVAGVVLIESMSPQPSHAAVVATSHAPSVSLAWLAARVGLVRLLAGPLGLTEGMPRHVGPTYLALLATPRYFRTLADETEGLPTSLKQAGAVTTLGDLPLIVLSRGLNSTPDWQARQARLLQLSSNSRQFFARHSGHSIQLDQPDAAVAAIVDMVEALRSARPDHDSTRPARPVVAATEEEV